VLRLPAEVVVNANYIIVDAADVWFRGIDPHGTPPDNLARTYTRAR
jgi:hypothetical protein